MEGWEMDLGRELEVWGMEAFGAMNKLGWAGTLRGNEQSAVGEVRKGRLGTLSHWGR